MLTILAMPVPFGSKHLIGTLTVLFIVAFMLVLLLKVLKVKNHSRVLKIATVILLFLEVMKQTKGIIDAGEYPLWALPFQLCSVPLYLFRSSLSEKARFGSSFFPAPIPFPFAPLSRCLPIPPRCSEPPMFGFRSKETTFRWSVFPSMA